MQNLHTVGSSHRQFADRARHVVLDPLRLVVEALLQVRHLHLQLVLLELVLNLHRRHASDQRRVVQVSLRAQVARHLLHLSLVLALLLHLLREGVFCLFGLAPSRLQLPAHVS